ncbi:flagellin [Halobacillus salinarum]|uniref:Flagellin n=1 Tax=Halobacillus salinarum TaxID=2932257 RepID=A0ABY4EUB5_9BACI|nr:flagellin [Halobacillus salinarum]UOQ45731.1 flagellin [Halobacillus salinarum]
MRINHNIAALNTYRQLGQANKAMSGSMEKLSSGMRINKAGDDAAGLAISEKMRGQIRGLDMASKNAQDGVSFIQTAEGALNETHSILQRMRELATQSANDTNTDSDRAELQKEVDQLAQEITRVSNNTEFNTQSLLNGGIKDGNLGKATFHIGANSGQNLGLEINAMDAFSLGVGRNVTTATLQSGATDTTGVSLDASVGSGVLNGANLQLSAKDTAIQATETNTKLQTVNNTSKYNGYTVSVTSTSGAADSFNIDNDAKTITISLDADDTAASVGSANSFIKAQTGGSDFEFSATPVVGTGTLAGALLMMK